MYGYLKEQELKIIRTKHIIVFKEGTRVNELRSWLARIDDLAVVNEIDYDEGSLKIKFHQDLLNENS